MLSRLSRLGSNLSRTNRKLSWKLKLTELKRYLKAYCEEYEKRKRNGSAIYNLWKNVKHAELLKDKLEEFSADRTDKMFLAARENEYKCCLGKVTSSMKEAVNFIKEFNRFHDKDVDVTANELLINSFRAECENGEAIARELEGRLKVWQENLCREIYGEQYSDNIVQFNQAIDDKMLEIKQNMLAEKVADFNSKFSMERKILESLKQALTSAHTDEFKIKYLTLVAEDIDAVRHIPNIKKLTDIARQLLEGVLPRLNKKDFIRLFTVTPGDQLEQFGPLGVVSVGNLEMFDFTGSYDSRKYIFRAPDTGVASTGYLSKFSKLTVAGSTKENLKIDSQAVYYCYVYPIKKTPLKCKNKFSYEEHFPDYNLLIQFGGYAYFNSSKDLIQLNAVHYNGENVYFGRKMQLSNPTETILELRRQGRLHGVNFSEVVAQGVEQYAWLVPGEFDNANHGAFLFTFKDRNIPPCYFELVPHNVGSSQATVYDQVDNEHLGLIIMSETLNM